MIKWLEKPDDDDRKELKDLNVKFTPVNLSDYIGEDNKINSENRKKLGEKIRSLSPTAVFETFCWTDRSRLKDYLVAEGITSSLHIMDDHWNITGKR